MYELCVRETLDREMRPIWCSDPGEEHLQSLERLLNFMKSLEISCVFPADARFRVRFFNFLLLSV